MPVVKTAEIIHENMKASFPRHVINFKLAKYYTLNCQFGQRPKKSKKGV
jgi:hypothetical protein